MNIQETVIIRLLALTVIIVFLMMWLDQAVIDRRLELLNLKVESSIPGIPLVIPSTTPSATPILTSIARTWKDDNGKGIVP